MSQNLKPWTAIPLLNIEVDNISLIDLLTHLKQGIVFTPNVNHLIKLQQDLEFWRIYKSADYRLCDSQILLYASRLLGNQICERISGSDFFPAFYTFHKDNSDVTIFLLGGLEGVPEKAAAAINSKSERRMVVGTYSPPFGFENDEQECQLIVDKIVQSGASVLAVGVGAPKQEKWIWKFKHKLPKVKIILAIGATINFEAGIVDRAPKWLSNSGLEWLFRLMIEPKRLWKRYVFDMFPLVWLLLRQKVGLYSNPWTVTHDSVEVDEVSSL
ncbi:WecB/TagA/CpsF family glycosyltransferase [Leptolyngbyaceae cyanobacterium UHCC 1019]